MLRRGLGIEHGHARLSTRLGLFAAVAAPLPVVVATTRAVNHGWVPAGDTALFAIRARDVFSTHPPLVGTWTSRSLGVGKELHHPGPLLFDLLAVPVHVFGSRAAVLIGVALVNALAIVGIAIVGHRRGGPLLATAAVAVAVGLAWSMGSEVLLEPWNPHSVLLPFLCFLMLAWSVTCGDVWALPWVAGVGSLVLQTHLSYGLLVPVLGAWAVLGLVLDARRHRRDDPKSWPEVRRRVRRAGVTTGVVLATCWAQPVVEQFTGDGNLTRLVGSSFGDSESSAIGGSAAIRVVAAVVSLPPFWLRPSFGDVEPTGAGGWRPPSVGLGLLSLALLALVLGWCWRDARRRHDRTLTRLLTTAGIVVVTGLVTATTIHPSPFGPSAHLFRWVWPVGAFVTFTIVAALVRALAQGPERTEPLVAVLASVTLVLVALSLPASNQGASTPSWAIPVARDLTAQMSGFEQEVPLFVDAPQAFDPYGPAVMAELSRRDIPFIVPSELVVQYGEARRFDGDNARAVLYVRTGPAIDDVPIGARRVALVKGVDDDHERELSRLEDELGEYLRKGRLRLNQRGQRVTERDDLPELERQLSSGSFDPEPLYESREILKMVEEELLILEGRWASRFADYADLQYRADRVTVALFLGPF